MRKLLLGLLLAAGNRAGAELKATLAKWNIEPTPGTPEAFGAFIAQESKRWREAVAASGLKLE